MGTRRPQERWASRRPQPRGGDAGRRPVASRLSRVSRRPWPDELPDVFRGSAAVAQGVLTPAQLRNPRLVRVLQDVYRPVHVPLTHPLKCRAAGLVAPSGSRLTGRSLATVLDVPLLGPADDVEMVGPAAAAGDGVRGIRLRAASRGPLGSAAWRGVPITTPERLAYDLAARFDLETAVSHLDAVARAGLVDLDALAVWLRDRHDDDVCRVREACALADPRAESPPESVCRVRLVRAGFDVVPQHRVRDHRGVVARVDLALLQLRIAIEYEGAWHAALADQLHKDRQRLNRLREAGWLVVYATAETLRERGALVDAVRRAVAQRTREG